MPGHHRDGVYDPQSATLESASGAKLADLAAAAGRTPPNVLITGTPGTGKTTTSELLATATGFEHINVGDLVKEKDLHEGWDDEYQCYILDEDKLCDALEDRMAAGGIILDHHSCDFFPERWFSLVVVLQTDNSVLYDRLVSRGYSGRKLEDNMECEIMQVLLEEAREGYESEIVHAMQSNDVSDIERNVEQIIDLLRPLCD